MKPWGMMQRLARAAAAVVEEGLVLYLRPGGVAGETTFTDSGPLARAIARQRSETVESDVDAPSGAVAHFPAGTVGLRLAHIADDNPLDGAFQLDWKLKLDSNYRSSALPIFGVCDGATYSQAYEWAVFVGANFIQFYYGSRGNNQAHMRFFFPDLIDLRGFYGLQVDLSIARNAAGDWGAWLNGNPSTLYQTSPSGSGVRFGSITSGQPNNPVNLGATSIPYSWLGGNMSGVLASNDVGYNINELKYVVGGSREIGAAYTPNYPSDPLPESVTAPVLLKLTFDEWPPVDHGTFSLSVNVSGSISQDTTDAVSGAGSMARGVGYNYVNVYDTSASIGLRNFWLRGWVKPDSIGGGGQQIFFDNRRVDNGASGFSLSHNPTHGTIKWSPVDNVIYKRTTDNLLTAGAWNFVEYVRIDGIGYFLVNGKLFMSNVDVNAYDSPWQLLGGATYSPRGAAGMPGKYDQWVLSIGSDGPTEDYFLGA